MSIPEENIATIFFTDRDKDYRIKMDFVFTRGFQSFMEDLRKKHGKDIGMPLADKILDHIMELNKSQTLSSTEVLTALSFLVMFIFDAGSTGWTVKLKSIETNDGDKNE